MNAIRDNDDKSAAVSTAQSSTKKNGRMLFVDGLRGIAAMSVVIFHFYGHLRDSLDTWLPSWIAMAAMHGYLGVPIFFVISGLVITQNIGLRRITGSYVGRFALRRSIRLDPPYWLAIAVSIGMAQLATVLFSDLEKTTPTITQIAAHLLYLQNLLGLGDIVPIFWTLCFEVQFYLFILLLLGLGQLTMRTESTRSVLASAVFRLALLALTAVSVLDYVDLVPWEIPGLFLPYWFAFSLGSVTIWTLLGYLSNRYWLTSAGIVFLGLAAGTHQPTIIVAVGTASALLIAGRTRGMANWLSGPVMQFLGRISYSLYLFHAIIGWSAVSVFKRFWTPGNDILASSLAFAFGLLVSVAAAWAASHLVERPSISLSRRIQL